MSEDCRGNHNKIEKKNGHLNSGAMVKTASFKRTRGSGSTYTHNKNVKLMFMPAKKTQKKPKKAKKELLPIEMKNDDEINSVLFF